MELRDAITQLRAILWPHLARKQECAEFVEIVLVLLVGLLWGLYNPYQRAQQLNCAPGACYRALHSLSAHRWRALLETMMLEPALTRRRHYQQRSPATRSRCQATLTIDDSVVRRFGGALSYLLPWYSGQFQKVVRGQDLVGIVLHLGDHLIPLSLVWVRQQGSGPTSKPEVLLKEMTALKEHVAQQGVDLTPLGLSLDAWWISEELRNALWELGFDKQVIAATASLQLREATGAANLGERRRHAQLKVGSRPRPSGATVAGRQSDAWTDRRDPVCRSPVDDLRSDLPGTSTADVRRLADLGEPSRGRDLLEET